MFRLLIVDDEQMIVDWLYNLFAGLSHLDLDIYKAVSGMEAIAWLNRAKIDIVLSDIRMPEMNGLQLMEEIHRNWPDCRVIFLTGHNEFEYIYSATRKGGVSYLLKTEEDSEIIKEVEKAIEEIEKGFKNQELINSAMQQKSMALPLLQREYLSALLLGEQTALPVRQQQLDVLEIPLKAEEPVVLLLGCMDHLSNKLSRIEKMQWIYSLKHLVEQYLLPGVSAAYVLYEDSYLVWFIQPLDSFASWDRTLLYTREILETVQKICRDSFQASISFALQGEPSLWDCIIDKYYYLKQLLSYRVGSDSGVIITGEAFIEKPDELSLSNQTLPGINYLQNRVNSLESYLESGQKADYLELLSIITEDLVKIKSMHNTPALEVYFTVSRMVLSYINRWSIGEKLAFKTSIIKLTRVDEFMTWNDAIEYLRQLSGYIFELQESDQERRVMDTVTRIQAFIQEHLAEDISLVRLGELMHFNPTYLSRLFKQITGANISEYVQTARMNKAKELLAKSDMKIHEIAALVGLESPTYFSKFFKKAVNMTPQEYRDSLLKI